MRVNPARKSAAQSLLRIRWPGGDATCVPRFSLHDCRCHPARASRNLAVHQRMRDSRAPDGRTEKGHARGRCKIPGPAGKIAARGKWLVCKSGKTDFAKEAGMLRMPWALFLYQLKPAPERATPQLQRM